MWERRGEGITDASGRHGGMCSLSLWIYAPTAGMGLQPGQTGMGRNHLHNLAGGTQGKRVEWGGETCCPATTVTIRTPVPAELPAAQGVTGAPLP